MRMDRRAGLLYNKQITLAELFDDATVVVVEDPYYGGAALAGVNGSNAISTYITVPKNTTVYILAFHSEGFCIGKVYNTSYTAFIGNVTPTAATYSNLVRVSLSIRNGAMVAVTFPHFSEEEVDTAFAAIQQQQIYAGHATSSNTRSTANSNFNGSGLYVVAHGVNYSMSISAKEDLFTPIFSCCTSSGTPDIVYLYRSGDTTYLSKDGTSATKMYGGRISRLY